VDFVITKPRATGYLHVLAPALSSQQHQHFPSIDTPPAFPSCISIHHTHHHEPSAQQTPSEEHKTSLRHDRIPTSIPTSASKFPRRHRHGSDSRHQQHILYSSSDSIAASSAPTRALPSTPPRDPPPNLCTPPHRTIHASSPLAINTYAERKTTNATSRNPADEPTNQCRSNFTTLHTQSIQFSSSIRLQHLQPHLCTAIRTSSQLDRLSNAGSTGRHNAVVELFWEFGKA